MERYDDVSFSKCNFLPRLLLPPRVGSDWYMSVLAWLIAPFFILPTLEQGAGRCRRQEFIHD
jgi:hypothetical protein